MSMPNQKMRPAAQQVLQARPSSAAPSAEHFRTLFASLELSIGSRQVVIGVTSAVRGEGRTSIAVGLAMTIRTDLDVPITLVDVDLENPSLVQYFGTQLGPGLAEVLQGKHGFEAVKQVLRKNLSVVGAGSVGPDPLRLLRRLPDQDLFHTTHDGPGVTILDLPPILTNSYSMLAASVADVAILVVRAGVTPAPLVREAIARLGQRPPHGIVLNGFRSPLPSWWPMSGV